MKLIKIDEGIIYGNKKPKTGDLSSYMSYFCEVNNKDLLASVAIGSCFDAPDAKAHILKSEDNGKTFFDLGTPFRCEFSGYPVNAVFKISKEDEKHILAMGYGFVYNRGDMTLANVKTNGLLDCPAFFSESFDGGKSFTEGKLLNSSWGYHTEASAPITVLKNGDYITPIAAMPDWDGKYKTPMCGRLLRSSDKGKTWNDDVITMDLGVDTTVWEQRIAVTDSGKIVDIAWNENLKTGELYNNHAVISTDNGKTFKEPIDTGIKGQATGILAIGGDRVLVLHSMRRHVERYGVLATIVNLQNNKWDVEYSDYIWEPEFEMTKTEGNLDAFSMLKFGQPSAIKLSDGNILYTHWLMENDVCRTVWYKFKIGE